MCIIVCFFKDTLNKTIENYIPKKKIRSAGNGCRNSVFMTNKLEKSKMRRKERLWKRYKNSGDTQTYELYKRVRNQVRRLSRNSVRFQEKNTAYGAKENPKKFWSYVKSKSKTKTSISDMYKDNNKTELTNTDSEKADVLGEFFSSVFTIDIDNE